MNADAASLARAAMRSVGFACLLALAAADALRARCFGRHARPLHRRARWLQRWSRVVARFIGLQIEHRGPPPGAGMIVSNHLSYLDILCYSALVPCVFVAKREVASWPVLGLLARLGGTIFVDRTRRLKVAEANAEIAEALRAGVVVVFFPEGTSSDGRSVLPFRTSLFEPAASLGCAITPAAIGFRLEHGSVAEEVCYWRDMTLLPHLLNLFTKRRVLARVAFGESEPAARHASRKDAAQHLHRAVAALHTAYSVDLT
jgi:1-acyl-sn-glycerol-3-phosphate acyltransferase